MGACNEQVFDGVFFFGFQAGDPFATSFLGFVHGGWKSFDVPLVGDRNDHGFLGDKVFHVVVAELLIGDLSNPIVAVLAGNFDEIFSYQGVDLRRAGEDLSIAFDLFEDRRVFLSEFFLFQAGQLAESHPEDGVGLDAGEFVVIGHTAFELEVGITAFTEGTLHHRGWAFDAHELFLGLCLRSTRSDDRDDVVDIGKCQQEAFDDVFSFSGGT